MSEKKVFDYYEIKEHSLVLYFLELGPEEIRKVPINLKADVPGTYNTAANAAYVYYNNDLVDWRQGNSINIKQ
jgi:hypothetical protein